MARENLDPEEKAFLDGILVDVPPARPPRCEVTGRFLPGYSYYMDRPPVRERAPGTHGCYNFRSIIKQFIEAHGGYTEDVVIDLFQSLMMAARLGDSRAASILLDRFCGKDVEGIDITLTTKSLSDVERGARLAAILHAAQQRSKIKVTG